MLLKKIARKIARLRPGAPRPILFDWSIIQRVLGHFEGRKATWQARGSKTPFRIGHYFEFGCYDGDTIIDFVNVIRDYYGKELPPYWNVLAFDSFEGLPASRLPEDLHPHAGEGSYKSSGEGRLRQRVLETGWPDEKFRSYKGFYEDALTNDLATRLLDEGIFASFVNIDCDYYSSTMTVLDWIEPLLVDGSILYFDDIYYYNCNPHKGELKAIEDFNARRSNSGLALAPFFDVGARCYMYWRNEALEAKKFEFQRYVTG